MSVFIFPGSKLQHMHRAYRAIEREVLGHTQGWQDIGSGIPVEDLRKYFRAAHVANMAEWLDYYQRRHRGSVTYDLGELPPAAPAPDDLPPVDLADRYKIYLLLQDFRLLYYNASSWMPPEARETQLAIERNLSAVLMKEGELRRHRDLQPTK